MTKHEADNWIRFLRSYGPVVKNDNMFAEESRKLSRSYNIPELRFEHPSQKSLLEAFAPKDSRLANVMLIATAGDGKSWLCFRLWEHLGGVLDDLDGKPTYKALSVNTPSGTKLLHFIFDLSGWAPEGRPWQTNQIELLNRFAGAVNGTEDEYFVVGCNDGKLLQTCVALSKQAPDSPIAKLGELLTEMLTTGGKDLPGKKLLPFNLTRISSALLFNLALDALLSRKEWECFDILADDPAYGPQSPLRKNFALLKEPLFRFRLHTLFELCDANGFHVPVRETLMLLVNGLLGHPHVNQQLMKAADVRNVVAKNTTALAAIYRNVFGANLSTQKRRERKVFSYFDLFRVGQETSNEIDNLLLFGNEVPQLRADFERLVSSDSYYGANPTFERLRQDYLLAEEFGEEKREDFMAELMNERRRLFFRVPEEEEDILKVWQLTVFQSAGDYRRKVLLPLREKCAVSVDVIETIVRGLNRAWSGMLVDDGSKLHLTAGLDFTTARISPIAIHQVPVAKNIYGEQVTIELGMDSRPALVVRIFGETVSYHLHLLRFEFLSRVANGSLPNSFSRECYEDLAAFKSRLLALWQKRAGKEEPTQLRIMEIDEAGIPREYKINL